MAAAEFTGPLPASKVGRQLGIPAEFIRDCCQFAKVAEPQSASYRHVDYFDTEAIHFWMLNATEAVAKRGQSFAKALAAWKIAQKEKQAAPALTYSHITVKWRVWGGDQSQAKTTERVFQNCTIRDSGGKFVTITLPDGQTVRKGRHTDSFEVFQPDGLHRVVLRYNRLEARAAASMTAEEKQIWANLQRLPAGMHTDQLKTRFSSILEKRLQLAVGALAGSDLGCPAWQAAHVQSAC